MKTSISCTSVYELGGIARQVLSTYPDNRIFALRGAMGAGKTTFIKALCAGLGVTQIVSSPSFAIINEYISKDRKPVFHFDFYRIKKTEEVMDIGYEEYLYSGNYCFLEWPEKIEELLPDNIVNIYIEEYPDNGSRIIRF